MLKKILLPLSALALMAFVACDDSTSASSDDAKSSSSVEKDAKSSSSAAKDDAKSSSSVEKDAKSSSSAAKDDAKSSSSEAKDDAKSSSSVAKDDAKSSSSEAKGEEISSSSEANKGKILFACYTESTVVEGGSECLEYLDGAQNDPFYTGDCVTGEKRTSCPAPAANELKCTGDDGNIYYYYGKEAIMMGGSC